MFSLNEPLDSIPEADWIVSYGYRNILKGEVLSRFHNRMINIHISLLPWNRGAEPNFWSWLEQTPKGVTIHRIDPGIGSGEILVQKEMTFKEEEETLAHFLEKLQTEANKLFDKH